MVLMTEYWKNPRMCGCCDVGHNGDARLQNLFVVSFFLCYSFSLPLPLPSPFSFPFNKTLFSPTHSFPPPSSLPFFPFSLAICFPHCCFGRAVAKSYHPQSKTDLGDCCFFTILSCLPGAYTLFRMGHHIKVFE